MNIVFVNPYSSGGKGIEKWKRIRDQLKNESFSFIMNGRNKIDEQIKNYLNKGITNFAAAGGDGTINYILNRIINCSSPDDLSRIKLGAIGIGSSNDFHKPFGDNLMEGNIPARINFDKAEPRDVGCVSFLEGCLRRRKYFLINASIGITAEANDFFNNPDKLLSLLKKKNTSASILYCALKTISGYKNQPFVLYSRESGAVKVNLTNLGVIKNPNFSGSLRYNTDADYTSGYFDAFVCHDMSKWESIELLNFLGKGRFDKVKKKQHWMTNELIVSSEKVFSVEYDGEIIKTNSVTFSVLPQLIKVCTC
jgi:diacylglycerol kinase (ATP)